MKMFKRKPNYKEFVDKGLSAILSHIPKGYEINKIRVQLDPEFDYSSIDYVLEKIE